MKKEELLVGTIYNLKKIGINIFKICVIESNRKSDKLSEDKLKSCEEVGMQTPAIFMDALLAYEAGYNLIDVFTGKKLTKEECASYLVIVEGNGRFWAFMKALQKEKKDPTYKAFEYIFIYVKYTDADSFKKTYRQINLNNVKTTGQDYARDLMATSVNPLLKSYNEKVSDGMLSKAAGYATICKELHKREILNEFTPDKAKTSVFDDTEILKITEPIFAKVKEAFGCEKKLNGLIKTVPLWKWIADKLNSATDKQAESCKIVKMFDNLKAKDAKELESAKKQDYKSKGTVIAELLDKIYLTV